VVCCRGKRRRWRIVTIIHHLPYFLLLLAVRHVVSQLGFFVTGNGHSLVARRHRRRWVRRVEAGLNESFSRVRRDHRLKLARRERVHVAGLARDQQHHLRPRKRRQLVCLESKNKTIKFLIDKVKLYSDIAV